MIGPPRISTLFPYPPLSRSRSARPPRLPVLPGAAPVRASPAAGRGGGATHLDAQLPPAVVGRQDRLAAFLAELVARRDRKSTRLNSSHGYISYAVFCFKKKK